MADNKLPETVAGWTTDLAIAKSFKGGVPPKGEQGVIFEITPPEGCVVINLVDVYRDPTFQKSVEDLKTQIVGFSKGIGCYGDEEKEVVLELGSLKQTHIYCLGGFSSDQKTLATEYFGHEPTSDELKTFKTLYKQAKIPPAKDWWLSTEGTKEVMRRILSRISKLKKA